MKNIRGVIFDLDGTIANTLPLCISAFRKAIEPLIKRSVTDEEIIATFGPSEEGTIMALVPEYYDKGVMDYLSHYESLHAMCPALFEGIEPLLTSLKDKNVRIAMVTGKGEQSAAISLRKFNVVHFFELIETGSSAGPRKVAGIQSILDEWAWKDINKDEVIYVGDAPGDIDACRRAGVAIVAAAWAETAEPEKLKALEPDLIFYRVEDFAAWLESAT